MEIDPENAYSLRNLGTLQQQTSPEQALAGLEKAARMMPNDSQAQYAYAKCLMDLGQNDEADPIFQRVIKMDTLSEVAEMARTCRREITQETMRGIGHGVHYYEAMALISRPVHFRFGVLFNDATRACYIRRDLILQTKVRSIKLRRYEPEFLPPLSAPRLRSYVLPVWSSGSWTRGFS